MSAIDIVAGDASHLRRCAALGVAYCYATTAVVFGAVAFAASFVKESESRPAPRAADLAGSLSAWGSEWYAAIAREGYEYDPARQSRVAFFPVYPCVAAMLSKTTGLPAGISLLVVSHACLLASFVVLAAYAAARSSESPGQMPLWSLIAFGLFPNTFYLRMAYSESTFLCLALLAMYGMARGWRPWAVAVVVGLATATRPVGVALLAPLAMYVSSSRRSRPEINTRQPTAGGRGRVFLSSCICAMRAAALVSLGCWGLLTYMAYQWWAFGEPLAFVKTQASWSYNAVEPSPLEHARRLATLAPLRAVYDRASPCYWGLQEPRDCALFNIAFLNPICAVVAVAVVAYGSYRGWLNRAELTLSAGLLLIPYVTQADRLCMWSQARFASVVFPMYLVFGNWLTLAPAPLAAAIVALGAVLLAGYSALFVSWHWF